MEIEIDKIKYDEERARAISDDETNELARSISEQGQLQPITVTIDGPFYNLVFGLRRLLAIRSLKRTTVRADIKNLGDKAIEIVRLHENLQRHNLPWFEEVLLKAKLHELRQAEHGGQSGRGRPRRGEVVWSVRDTARELGIQAFGHLADDLKLAREVQADPSLRNIKDKKTALQQVRRKVQRMQAEEEAGAPLIGSRKDEFERNVVHLGGAVEVLKSYPDTCFDACITDPPWIKFHDKKLVADEETAPVFKEIYRTLKFNTLLYVFAGLDDYVFYNTYLPKLGFQVSKTPLFWKKSGGLSRIGVRQWEYSRDFEFILLAAKGDPILTHSTQQSSFFCYDVVPTRALVHPNEKPKDIIKHIMNDCTYPGHTILDPFGGSGVLGEVCKENERHYVICERDEETCAKIKQRLK